MNPLRSWVASHVRNIKDQPGSKILILKPNKPQTVRNTLPKDSIRLKGFTNVPCAVLAVMIYKINPYYFLHHCNTGNIKIIPLYMRQNSCTYNL